MPIHILSIQLYAVRARRRVLPIRRSVQIWRWSTPDVGRVAMCVARKEFVYSYCIYTILSLPTDVSAFVVPPIYFHALNIDAVITIQRATTESDYTYS